MSSASQKKNLPLLPLRGMRQVKKYHRLTKAKEEYHVHAGPKPSRAELAKVHIAKRDLKLTDQLYRGFLNVLFGETSAKDITHEQIDELLDHFKSLGWESGTPSAPATGAVVKTKDPDRLQTPHPITTSGRKPATMAQLSLIMYLWQHGSGIRNESLQALDHFLNHHFHVSQLSEVKAGQVSGILGAIKNMGKV